MLSLLIDSVDKHTQSHCYRVSIVAERIAREMGCPEGEVENIRIAALLHDLGKLGISGEILKKVGALSFEERENIKNHTKLGADMLAPVGGKVLLILPYFEYNICFDFENGKGKRQENFVDGGFSFSPGCPRA